MKQADGGELDTSGQPEPERFWLPWSEWTDAERADLESRLTPEDGWGPLNRGRSRGRTFVPSELVDDRVCVRSYLREDDQRVVAKVWFGPGAEGPPGHAHGGSQSAVMDHVLGAAVWTAGHPAFTGRLTYTYRKLLPLGTVARCEAWVESAKGRKIIARGRLYLDGVTYGESEGLFIRMREEHLKYFRDR